MTLINHFCSKVKCNKFVLEKEREERTIGQKRERESECDVNKHFCSMNFHQLAKAAPFAKLFCYFFSMLTNLFTNYWWWFSRFWKTFLVRQNKFYAVDNNRSITDRVRKTKHQKNMVHKMLRIGRGKREHFIIKQMDAVLCFPREANKMRRDK